MLSPDLLRYGNAMTDRSSDGRKRRWLGRLLGLPEPPPPTRLTAEQAVALAAATPAVRDLGRALPVATAAVDGDRVVWRVSRGGVGAQTWVEVDDATGAVGEVHDVWGR